MAFPPAVIAAHGTPVFWEQTGQGVRGEPALCRWVVAIRVRGSLGYSCGRLLPLFSLRQVVRSRGGPPASRARHGSRDGCEGSGPRARSRRR